MSTVILVFVSHILFIETTCYVLTSSELTWNGSSNFCKWKCNSELASIHNEQQQQQILNLINNDNINQLAKKSYWIGLYKDNITQQWIWTDNSGTHILNTSYDAWYPAEPNNDYENCVELHVGFNYSWNDARCDKNTRAICNQCVPTLQLNKYVEIYGAFTFDEANNECYQQYGTQLASIHNDRDQVEASILCKSSRQDACWLGASDRQTEGIWIWNDGTEWNYTHWSAGRPNNVNDDEHCLQIWQLSPGEFDEWDDYTCENTNGRHICFMPSYLCFYDKWNVIKGNWTWMTSAPMCGEVIQSDRRAGNIVWYGDETGNILPLNVWNDMIIEYTYTMTNTANYNTNSNGGIIFRAQMVSDVNNVGEYYNAEIRPNTNSVALSRTYNNTWTRLKQVNLNFIYQEGIYYRLKVEIVDNNFKVYVNDELYINYNDTTQLFTFGTIGLRNYQATTISKYLYVSEYTYSTFNPTTDPTFYPTVNPTSNPTNIPTFYPTNYPTSNPTNIPTFYPTNIPTFYPTNIPTEYPTISTLNPTNIPTYNPTIYPTIYPTYNPTNNPTLNEGGVGYETTISETQISVIEKNDAQSSNDISEVLFMVLIAVVIGLICIIIILGLLYVVVRHRSHKNVYLDNVDRQSTGTIDQQQENHANQNQNNETETETQTETKGEKENVNLEMQNVHVVSESNGQSDAEDSYSEMYNDGSTKGNIVTPNYIVTPN